MRAAVFACLLAGPTLADTPLTADAFAAHVGTDTVTYVYSTGERGSADYGPDRTLRWAFEGEPCFDGIWFAETTRSASPTPTAAFRPAGISSKTARGSVALPPNSARAVPRRSKSAKPAARATRSPAPART
ncbi:MAG: hypothetical protein V4583_00355 [Pseudomonadota bacterium]